MIRALSVTVSALFLVFACLLGAEAASSRFALTVEADGVTLGTASAVLLASTGAGGNVTWTLEDGDFSAANLPDAKVIWDETILAGSGEAAAGPEVVIKQFRVVVQQSTGVNVSYRFRLIASLGRNAIESVEIEQLK